MATRKQPGGTGDDPPPSEPSSSRTQRRMLVEPSSLAIEIAVDDSGDAATQPTMQRSQLVVMEEKAVGLADALARLGYLIRPATTGVEAMSLVANRAPHAVIAGPGDAERRRVLVGALRLRFPHVPVVLVMPVVDEGSREMARRDGVHAVLSWPLPGWADVYAAIPGSQGMGPTPRPSQNEPKTLVVPPTAALAPVPSTHERALLSADQSAEFSRNFATPASMAVTLPPQFMTPLPPPATASLPPDATATLLQPRIDVSGPRRPAGVEKRPEQPGKRPPAKRAETRGESKTDDYDTLNVARVEVPLTGDENAATTPSRPGMEAARLPDVQELLAAVAPLLWGLDDCARYLEDLQTQHVVDAGTHAKTVRLAARLLSQLHARSSER